MNTADRNDLRATCHSLLDDVDFTDDDLCFVALLLTLCQGSRPGAIFAKLREIARRNRTRDRRCAAHELKAMLNQFSGSVCSRRTEPSSLIHANEANHD